MNPTRRERHLESTQDLYLADDPHLLERNRWRAVLGDAPPTRKADPKDAQWPHYGLAIVLGLVFALLIVHGLSR